MERELTPQEAALVWVQVPQVDQELTPRAVGLSHVLVGLAIALGSIPGLLIPMGDPQGNLWLNLVFVLGVPLGTVLVVLLVLWVRSALWRVYALARPHDYRGPLANARAGYGWWYLVALGYYALVLVMTLQTGEDALRPVDTPLARTGDLVLLMLAAYTLTTGHWERRKDWSRRPYLLVAGVVATGLAFGVLAAFGTSLAYGVLGAGWMLAGALLHHQV